MNNCEAEVFEKYGNTNAYKEHKEKTKSYTKEKWAEINEGLMALFYEFAQCKEKGSAPSSAEALLTVAKLQRYITQNYYTCTLCILASLGEAYVADPRFKKNIDKYGEGTAEFASESIKEYCEKKETESMIYCEYLKKEIDEGDCYDIQMISMGYISPSALPDIEIDKETALERCKWCKHKIC